MTQTGWIITSFSKYAHEGRSKKLILIDEEFNIIVIVLKQ